MENTNKIRKDEATTSQETESVNRRKLNTCLLYLKNNSCTCNLGTCEVCETVQIVRDLYEQLEERN